MALIAGSFHVWRDGEDAPFNEAVVLGRKRRNAGGDTPLWSQDKRGLFRLSRKQLQGDQVKAMFAPLPTTLGPEIVEGIQHGATLRLLDTSMGRLAVVICADLLEPSSQDSESFRELIFQARPEFVFVVSMSPKTDDFHRVAEDLARAGISILFVNSARVCGDGQDLAFAYLGMAEPPEAPATRLRWSKGLETLRALDRSRKPEAWAYISEKRAAARLAREGALILELGKHFGR